MIEVAFTTKASRTYTTACFQQGDALVFGPETRGLAAGWLTAQPPERLLRIPMRPEARSLNLANAAAVAVYEASARSARETKGFERGPPQSARGRLGPETRGARGNFDSKAAEVRGDGADVLPQAEVVNHVRGDRHGHAAERRDADADERLGSRLGPALARAKDRHAIEDHWRRLSMRTLQIALPLTIWSVLLTWTRTSRLRMPSARASANAETLILPSSWATGSVNLPEASQLTAGPSEMATKTVATGVSVPSTTILQAIAGPPAARERPTWR